MSVFNKFENIMQGAVEAPFSRLFRTHLEPVELANKLTRTMEAHLHIGHEKKLAPNVYEVQLSRRDYNRFNAYAQALQQQLSQVLIDVARERGYTLTSKPMIQFIESPSIGTGQARIECQTVDPHALPANAGLAAVVGLDETVSMSPEQAAAQGQGGASPVHAPQAVPIPPAWLTLYRPVRGNPMPFPGAVLHIGRHQSNDVVVNDKKVSRQHAVIRYENGQFILYDLHSTNGVGVNGVMTHNPVPLKNNDLVTVGSHEFITALNLQGR
ncbi:MAG: FhaA domain-containing protein, partial [Ktedonobacterales bacterium]